MIIFTIFTIFITTIAFLKLPLSKFPNQKMIKHHFANYNAIERRTENTTTKNTSYDTNTLNHYHIAMLLQ